jgi:hypothetical protein
LLSTDKGIKMMGAKTVKMRDWPLIFFGKTLSEKRM